MPCSMGYFRVRIPLLLWASSHDLRVLLSHANHDSLMPGPSNDGGEHSPGGVISGEPGLAHTGAVVNDQSGNFIVTHFAVCIKFSVIKELRCCSLEGWARLPM